MDMSNLTVKSNLTTVQPRPRDSVLWLAVLVGLIVYGWCTL